jgi:arylsulfatase A-like enzyme
MSSSYQTIPEPDLAGVEETDELVGKEKVLLSDVHRGNDFRENAHRVPSKILLIGLSFLLVLLMVLSARHTEIGIDQAFRSTVGHLKQSATSQPHIVFILTDDQGMGDMDYNGNDMDGMMPTIRKYNEAGVNMTTYYSLPLCTPARSALMTGTYPLNHGMQHGVIMGTKPFGLPLKYKILPEYLSEAGYSTYHIGKWHLGHYSKAHLPTARGFDQSIGYYGGYQHPTSHMYEWPGCSNTTGCVPDMHVNEKGFPEVSGQFNSYVFRDEAVKLIEEHASTSDSPMFMYFALPLMHMPVHPDEDVLVQYKDTLSRIEDKWRRKNAAMGIMLDNIFSDVTNALKNAGMMDNTVIVFASDNGAMATGSESGAGSNYPLRGSKGSLFEGGVRVPAFIYSPLLGHSIDSTATASKTQLRGLVHVSDWLPTLMSAVGRSDLLEDTLLDGIDQWDWISQTSEGSVTPTDTAPRTEILYNIDPTTGIAALRTGDWKLILNSTSYIGWFDGDTWGTEFCVLNPTNSEMLFNLGDDECEHVDVASEYPEIVTKMKQTLAQFVQMAEPIAYCDENWPSASAMWREKNQVEPWIEIGSPGEATDYECPIKTTKSGWCELVDKSSNAPAGPTDAHMGNFNSKSSQEKASTEAGAQETQIQR